MELNMYSVNIAFEAEHTKQRAFTLIELLVVVGIIGILSVIAYPAYQSYLMKGRRVSAQAHLMDIAQRQQQYLLDARSYAPDLVTLNVPTPNDVSAYYTITISTLSGPPPGFTATATPIAGTAQQSDAPLSIDNAGAKTPPNTW
jgi:type IV pilus assembly protein PilE